MTEHDRIDERLVAYLHGELGSTERREVAALLRRDPEARARFAVLASTDVALGEALERDAAPRATATLHHFVRPALAIAAALAVVAIFVFQGGDEAATAGRNDQLELRAAPRGGANAPLFTDAALELHWRNLNSDEPRRPIRVVPFPFSKTLPALGEAMDRLTHIGSRRMAVLPVVVTATITDPGGGVVEARWAPVEDERLDIAGSEAVQTVRLRDFELQWGRMRPTLVGRPGDREWVDDDAMWRFTHLPSDGQPRWFPELPGEYRVELAVTTLPAPDYLPWPQFDQAVTTTTAIVMAGRMTDWSEAHDGMVARLVWSEGARTGATTPFALQLRNDSKAQRKYNHMGTTIAKIPQPIHYTLIVDGVEWTQRDSIPLTIHSGELFQPHPEGEVRSLVSCPKFWHHDGKTLDEFVGGHEVQVLFHFEPSVWNAADTSIWRGQLLTPTLAIEVPAPK